MAGKRKVPRLRFDGTYYVVNIYRPDGRRTTISFGTAEERSEGMIYEAFGKWLDLYAESPHKVLVHKSPYDAVDQVVSPCGNVTVERLFAMYISWIKKSESSATSNRKGDNIDRTKRAMQFFHKCNDWPVKDFGPDELLDIRKEMQEYRYHRGKGKETQYTRGGINRTLKQIHRVWEWGVGRGLVEVCEANRLREVKSLRIGEGIDRPKRQKVTQEEFEAVVGEANSVVADMLWLIWYTAMRPSEVCKMRPYDILRDDPDCWLYIPGRDRSPVGEHKTMRFGNVKVITLTSEAQEILKSRITDFNSREYVFRPIDAVREFQQKRFESRTTPLNSGNKPGTNRKAHPMITPGVKYESSALRTACKRACKRAKVEIFTPYDIRRTVATGTRALLGKEAAKVLLGHTSTDTTDIYLLDEVQEAMKIAKLLAARNGSGGGV